MCPETDRMHRKEIPHPFHFEEAGLRTSHFQVTVISQASQTSPSRWGRTVAWSRLAGGKTWQTEPPVSSSGLETISPAVFKNVDVGQAWECTALIPTFERQKQVDL